MFIRLCSQRVFSRLQGVLVIRIDQGKSDLRENRVNTRLKQLSLVISFQMSCFIATNYNWHNQTALPKQNQQQLSQSYTDPIHLGLYSILQKKFTHKYCCSPQLIVHEWTSAGLDRYFAGAVARPRFSLLQKHRVRLLPLENNGRYQVRSPRPKIDRWPDEEAAH